ncbi:MAG: hypothetical protein GXP35_10270 [Actinobacteria bacterium]|nr:hypothetical protein [Actinomycetota bacterium]
MNAFTRFASLFGAGKDASGRGGSSPECRRVGEVLQMYLDGEFDGDTSWLTDHLDECADCGLDSAEFQQLKDAISRLGQPDTDTRQRLQEFADHLAGGEMDVVDDPV